MNNTKSKDNGGRLIFENATLCSQFLREYTGMELFKDLNADDVEDMTERYLPMFSEERDSDVVKKIRLHGMKDAEDFTELFIVALIEHKSSVDYNVSMQMLHYMSYIWEEYEKTMEAKKKGITKQKDFRYPPILPIVYYEDTDTWTSPAKLHDRIYLSGLLKKFVPDYEYFLLIYDLTDKIKEGNMNRLFEHFEGYDIQKVRKESETDGEDIRLIKQIHKKLERGKSPESIADDVEESVEFVNKIIDAINSVETEDFDPKKVLEVWKTSVTV